MLYCYFNPRSLTGATNVYNALFVAADISILAPSRERPYVVKRFLENRFISILAPSRERLLGRLPIICPLKISILAPSRERRYHNSPLLLLLLHFNPRSLTGATETTVDDLIDIIISILAPSRERPYQLRQSKPNGKISILAPSRERQWWVRTP